MSLVEAGGTSRRPRSPRRPSDVPGQRPGRIGHQPLPAPNAVVEHEPERHQWRGLDRSALRDAHRPALPAVGGDDDVVADGLPAQNAHPGATEHGLEDADRIVDSIAGHRNAAGVRCRQDSTGADDVAQGVRIALRERLRRLVECCRQRRHVQTRSIRIGSNSGCSGGGRVGGGRCRPGGDGSRLSGGGRRHERAEERGAGGRRERLRQDGRRSACLLPAEVQGQQACSGGQEPQAAPPAALGAAGADRSLVGHPMRRRPGADGAIARGPGRQVGLWRQGDGAQLHQLSDVGECGGEALLGSDRPDTALSIDGEQGVQGAAVDFDLRFRMECGRRAARRRPARYDLRRGDNGEQALPGPGQGRGVAALSLDGHVQVTQRWHRGRNELEPPPVQGQQEGIDGSEAALLIKDGVDDPPPAEGELGVGPPLGDPEEARLPRTREDADDVREARPVQRPRDLVDSLTSIAHVGSAS